MNHVTKQPFDDFSLHYFTQRVTCYKQRYSVSEKRVIVTLHTVHKIVFAEVIDHRSRVKMIHYRPTVYTCRPVMLSSSKTLAITIDHRSTRLDSLPSPTQFLPRSGPRSIGKVAHCAYHSRLTSITNLELPDMSWMLCTCTLPELQICKLGCCI